VNPLSERGLNENCLLHTYVVCLIPPPLGRSTLYSVSRVVQPPLHLGLFSNWTQTLPTYYPLFTLPPTLTRPTNSCSLYSLLVCVLSSSLASCVHTNLSDGLHRNTPCLLLLDTLFESENYQVKNYHQRNKKVIAIGRFLSSCTSPTRAHIEDDTTTFCML